MKGFIEMPTCASVPVTAEGFLGDLKTKVDKSLFAYLSELKQNSSLRMLPGLHDMIANFVAAGGRRIRPLLFLLAWNGYGGKVDGEILRISAAIELFHTFALVHDDLVDHSNVRRGQPALHIQLARQANVSEEAGQDLALLAGDLLYSAAIRAILSVEMEPERKVQAMQELMRVAIETGAGASLELTVRQQTVDTIGQDTVDTIQTLKTSQYTFVCPLTLAAILAGAGESELQRLMEFGTVVGQAYQIRDDLDDWRAFAEDPTMMQACEARLLWPFWRCLQQAEDKEREGLNATILQRPLTRLSLRAIQESMTSKRIFLEGEECIAALLNRSQTLLGASFMTRESKELLWQCVRGFFGNAGSLPEAQR